MEGEPGTPDNQNASGESSFGTNSQGCVPPASNENAETPAPGAHYWRRKGYQMSTWFSSLKKGLTRQRLHRSRKEKMSDMDCSRLSSSHPDVSLSHLADLADSGRHSENASLTSSPRRIPETSVTANATPVLFRKFAFAPVSTAAESLAATWDSGDVSLCGSSTGDDSIAKDKLKLDSLEQERQLLLRQHPFYELEVILRSGRNLVAKDSCGTSDPYVKFKVGGKLLHKSKTVNKNLNPEWNEKFIIPIEDVFEPLTIKVFDYDWGFHDDFMGAANFKLESLELHRPTEVSLELSETGKSKFMGTINLVFTLIPRSQEDKEHFLHRNTRLSDSSRKLKSQIWSSVVTIVLVEGKDLGLNAALHKDDSPLCPLVKFRLGNGKYKSKCCQKTSRPLWREQFDLHLFDDQPKSLEISVFDGSRYWDDMIGRCRIDLTEMEHEKTHRLWANLDNQNGSLFLLLTISGTTSSETITDLTNYEGLIGDKNRIQQRYNLISSFNNMKDVGHLTVKVFEARGLASADLGGKSDPFCVLELVNARLQTQTEYKTLSPMWRKVFTFNVKDIHSVLEVTVYDEDRDRKFEFLGKIAVPLLRVKSGEKKWFSLKDKKLLSRVKGEILLEMDLVYNPVRACLRTFNPREQKYMHQEEKFKKRTFVTNVLRVKDMVNFFIDMANFVQSCWEWDSPLRSTIAFMVFLTVTYNFQLYMTPFAILLIFFISYLKNNTMKPTGTEEDAHVDGYVEEEDDDERDKEEKKSLKERLLAIQEVILSVQVALGKVASIWESIKNTFNFSVPFLSWLAIVLLFITIVFLYFIPLRVLIIIWGINKFTKKLRSPHSVPNNEFLDFLSRVPDDEHLLMYREYKTSGKGNLEETVQGRKTS